jgi:hypothetical protein
MCDPPECYGFRLRTARKAHTCCECRGVINPREQYWYHHGVWDFRAQDFKVCLDCEELRSDVDCGVPYADETTGFEELGESIINSGVIEFIRRYVVIQQQRGAVVNKAMLDIINKRK